MSRGLSGFRAWLWQRATAVYVGLFTLYLVWHFLAAPPADVDALRAWLGGPAAWTGVAILGLALLLHAWIGVRDVLLDYVKPPRLRVALLGLVLLYLLANGLWLARVLLEVG